MKNKIAASDLFPAFRKGTSWFYNKGHYVFIIISTLLLLAFIIWLLSLFS
ncbi:MAG TPA: hypothetical protein VLO29_10750 [Salegentibacter sp.]|nr:hypothetical protein [Salegentibacter sp.]